MDRPGFVEMICQLEQGKAAAVFVKDLSRLGRNYIEVGRLTEEFFPNHDIRLVAVSDNIDTAEGENELAPIRNLFNEWYARDISKKRRISNKIKGNAGEPMGQPPYGYIKDPNDPKHWIVDDEAAQVVRRVYSMTLEGFGTEQIAAQLEKDDVLTPRAYWLTKGIKRPGKGKQQPPTKWNSSTITKILSLQEYCGDILNFKTYSKSYKNKKRIDNDRENWVVFQDVHEAIIERAVYEQVQQKRGKIRKRRTNNGEHNMFSGLLVCADCGSNLHFHFNAVWDHTEKLREQYAAELKKVTQLQKQWALRKPVLDAHCLTLQKEILRLEQEVDALVMEKLNGDGGSSAHEIGT